MIITIQCERCGNLIKTSTVYDVVICMKLNDDGYWCGQEIVLTKETTS